MGIMDDGVKETPVFIPYTDKVFRKNNAGQLRTVRRYVRRWLREHAGEHTPPLANCSAEFRWRSRMYSATTHVFFFQDPSTALMFKLTFGGS
jgi:hypothetical protein